eukprot:GHVH01005430.1.p1 GENE.GHVH01005430.1~~GHVH01005430.1.p1  ORF type:complete len:315 (-),score=60.43 GHVH01005430.1:702-1646(-)
MLESACNVGITKSVITRTDQDETPVDILRPLIDDAILEQWLLESRGKYMNENDDNSQSDPCALPSIMINALHETLLAIDSMPHKSSAELSQRLRKKILQRTAKMISVALGMLQRRKLQKLLHDPRVYREKLDHNSNLLPLDQYEIDVTSAMIDCATPEVVSFPHISTHLLATPSYSTYVAVHTLPSTWLLNLLKGFYDEFNVEMTSIIESYFADSGQDTQDQFLEDEIGYEHEFLEIAKEDWIALQKSIHAIEVDEEFDPDSNGKALQSGRSVIPLFRSSSPPWIPAGSQFVATNLLMHRVMLKAQGIISSVPC